MIKPLTDPREIRKLLTNAAYRGDRIDGKRGRFEGMNTPSLMARNVMQMAECNGYSGEDAMTVLAYHALLYYEDALDRLINDLNLRPSPPLVTTNEIYAANPR
jgi:hypothetical protein